MAALVYYITLPVIYLVSLLPFSLLYLLSDCFYVLVYHLIGYRKKVVSENLRNSFPEKTERELERIRRAYYRYLCDLMLETFKTLTIGRKKMLRHCAFTPEADLLFRELRARQQSAVLVMGHFGNWEWAGNAFSIPDRQQLYVIYHPISNRFFNRLMYRMRTRFGTRLIAMKDTFREMVARRKELSVTAFIADQTPPPENAFWLNFLNQDTPVFKGTELIAKKLNFPVIYTSVQREKRGFYKVHAEMLIPDPASLPEGKITELHTRRLEQDIIACPETWLWSHRRWKHKRPLPDNSSPVPAKT